ncbi:MAG: PIN domain-containing protein [Actinomycetota bacterium]
MILLLLDTTFPVDAERGAAELDDVIHDDDDVAIAAITLAELTVGVELASGRRRAGRQADVETIAASIPVLPDDEPVGLRHASRLVAVRRAGRPRGAHDLIIAATDRSPLGVGTQAIWSCRRRRVRSDWDLSALTSPISSPRR